MPAMAGASSNGKLGEHFDPPQRDSFHRSVSEGDANSLMAPLHDSGSNTFESRDASRQMARLGSRSLFSLPEKGDEELQAQARGHIGVSLFLGSRCTRVHFVRHAEGFHNVITKQAAAQPEVEEIIEKVAATALKEALAEGKTQEEAEKLSQAARTKKLRDEENKPVHFATKGGEAYIDAELTEAGQNQCYALRGKIDRNRVLAPVERLHVDLVVVSPLRRCLETADIIFGPARTQSRPDLLQPPFLVNDLCRERYGEFFCDKRLPMSETKQDLRFSEWDWETQREFAIDEVPFADDDEAWQEEREPEDHTLLRALKFLKWIAMRPEKEIAVVTHSSFLKCLFKVFGGESSKEDQDVLRALPANCELRTVVLCHHGA